MLKRIFNIALFIAITIGQAWSQMVTTTPAFPTTSGSITVVFDVSSMSGGLSTYTGTDVYVHTGVITNKSTSSTDWKYATTWLNNNSKYKLVSLGNKKWQFTITPDIKSFYGVPSSETVQKLMFVLRNSTGSVEGKNSGNDIAVPVYTADLNVYFTKPSTDTIVAKNTTINFGAIASESTTLNLLMNGTVISSANTSSSLTYSKTFTNEGSYQMVVQAGINSSYKYDTVNVFVEKDQVSQVRPAGTIAGINYPNDTTATLVLYAPGKSSVFVLGDFNDWTLSNDYMLNKDGDYWWITLNHLTKKQEYAFQYLVDGSLRIADPYTNKVLDPWNDPYIPSSVYPNLKAYPTGKTTGIVSVLQTAQPVYNWANSSYSVADKSKLIVYELLVRDFTSSHSFDGVRSKLDYLQGLGINAIELMPVNEFEGNSSWGYNPSFYFAVDKYYGTKDALKALIDECHGRGIAVILDLVLNHSFGQSPFVKLYWDSANSRPAANNPWYNVTSPNSTYSWGYDFNHESVQTKALVDSINSFWMKEFKVDGFRFDFTKGFTNTVGDGYSYDASRIAILERMATEIWKRNNKAYVIIEHLTANSEEKVLSDAGLMPWGNMNNAYCQSIMGWMSDSGFDWGIYTNRNWTQPNLVTYMESHDEERTMYKALTYGNLSGSYDVKVLSNALNRAKLNAAFFMLQPGPKMIWQFGELGYDFSINTASDGVTIGDTYRTDEKPIRWDYYTVATRKALYDVYAKLNQLKTTYPVFSSTDVTYSVGATEARSIVWRSSGMNAFVVGNFGVASTTVTATLPKTGTWYNVFTGESETFSSTSYSVTLAPGEFRLYTDNQALSSIENTGSDIISAVFADRNTIYNKGDEPVRITLFDLFGRKIEDAILNEKLDISNLQNGFYLIQVKDKTTTYTVKVNKY